MIGIRLVTLRFRRCENSADCWRYRWCRDATEETHNWSSASGLKGRAAHDGHRRPKKKPARPL